jgi:rubrerythrin
MKVFDVLAKEGKKLSPTECIRALRFCVAEEIHAAQVYQQLAESITDRASIQILNEIADHELMHVGQFLRLITELSSKDEKLYEMGAQETEGML